MGAIVQSHPIFFAFLDLSHPILIESSLASLAAIAYDRYLMTRPEIYHDKMAGCKVKIILSLIWGIPLLITSFIYVNIEVYVSFSFVFGIVLTIIIIIRYRMIIKRFIRKVNANPHQMQNTSNDINHSVETSNVHQNHCPGLKIDPHNSTCFFSKADVVRQPRSNPNQGMCPVSMVHNQARDSNNLSTIPQRNQQNLALRIVKNKKLARRLFTLIAAFGCCVLPLILLAISILVTKLVQRAGVVLDYEFMVKN